MAKTVEIPNSEKLTPLQQRFIRAFIETGDAMQAVKKAFADRDAALAKRLGIEIKP